MNLNNNEKNLKELGDDSPIIQLIATKLEEILLQVKESEKSDSERHSDTVCDICNEVGFKSYRYKCLTCNDYDLCSSCFEKRSYSNGHKLSHPMLRFESRKQFLGIKSDNMDLNLFSVQRLFQNKIHSDIACKACKQYIKGLRLKCDVCYDYDLCYSCYSSKKETLKHLYDTHPMVVEDKSSFKMNSNDIEFLEELGRGGFGTVFKAKLKSSNKFVACKRIALNNKLHGQNIPNSDALFTSYIRELDSYSEFMCKNIIKMLGYWSESSRDVSSFYVVTEYMEKKSLTHLLQKETDLSDRRKLTIACDIANGMVRIHERGYIHRDIRPDNILIDADYTGKIGDFGIAKVLDKSIVKQTLIGCRPYMPPEFYTGKYDQKLDILTYGLTLVELFGGDHSIDLPDKVLLKTKPQVFNQLITACISVKPNDRPDSKRILAYLDLYHQLIGRYVNKHVENYETF